MSLKAKLDSDLREAMKAGEETRKTTIRAVMAAARQAQLEKREALVKEKRKALGLKPSDDAGLDSGAMAEIEVKSALTDADYEAALRREAKARREATADAEKAGRADLILAQKVELAIIEVYLPQQLSREEIAARAGAIIVELGASGPAAQGNVMKRLMPELKGMADGKLVGEVVRELLSQ
ncbi:MAG: GatB/YqeY domain-containing protein [Chloroflexi bacterium]|nr:GatB/YqeY domain-containing protein [Chloroflexota bacterium]